jgi:hypothetical protein
MRLRKPKEMAELLTTEACSPYLSRNAQCNFQCFRDTLRAIFFMIEGLSGHVD